MSFGFQLEQDSSYKKPQKLFFALFGILFLIAPFYYQPNLGGEGLFIPHNSTIWIVASWIIATASFIIYRTNEIILPKYWFGLALMPIGAWITGFIAENNNPTEWFVRLSAITGGYLFFLSLFQFRLNSKQITISLLIILLMGLIASAYGFLQVLGLSDFFEFIPFSPENRPVGIFQQVNIQASMMATILVLTFYIATRLDCSKIICLINIALVTSCTISCYLILISGSRVGLLSVILAIPVIILTNWQTLITKKVLFAILIIATLTGGYLGKEGLESTSKKMDRVVNNIGGMDGDIRWKIYSQSWELFKQSPIVGHGLGSFQKVFQEHRGYVQSEGITSFGKSPRFSHPHNELIFWLVEGGTISILGIAIAALLTLLHIFRVSWRNGLTYTALLFPLTLHTQVELPFYISNTPWLLLIFLLFLCHNHERNKVALVSLSNAAKATVPISFCILSIISSYALTKTQVANAGIVKYLQTKQRNPIVLLPALDNAYFREYATYLILRKKLFLGIQNNEKKPALIFAEWAEISLETVPTPLTYRDLVIAYHFLGDKSRVERTLNHSLKIYPYDKDLLKLKSDLEQ